MISAEKHGKPNEEKLICYGFTEKDGCYFLEKIIAEGQLIMKVSISKQKFSVHIFDKVSGEEYVLHQIESAKGAFVGKVREEYNTICDDIYDKCFDIEIYRENQSKELLHFIKERFGHSPEFPWDDENSIVRRNDNRKWYAVFMKISARKIGIDSDEIIEVLNVKLNPELILKLVDGKQYFPAYHMNKKHWLTIPLGSFVDTEEIKNRIEESFALTK